MLTLAAGIVVVSSIRKSEDPARMVFKWILTAVVLAALFVWVAPMVGAGGATALFMGLPLTVACGFVLAGVWRHSLASLVAKPIASLYDGGDLPPIPHPAYSVALARQKRGRYQEAIEEIRKQLEQFPHDIEGQFLLAQIQAENLKDLPAAAETIDHFCSPPGHSLKNVAFAWYSLADWQLIVAHDRAAARRALERITMLMPDTEFALGAANRIAHLDHPDAAHGTGESRKYIVPESLGHFGVLKEHRDIRPQEATPAQVAAEYVDHLRKHPLDTDVRERLAVIYADDFGRLDLASDQLEQLIAYPNQPSKAVARWLNLLADLQVRHGATYEAVRATLQRIVDREPAFAAADIARKRIELLRLEFKGREQSRGVKMGTYEQNLGLKRGRGNMGRGG